MSAVATIGVAGGVAQSVIAHNNQPSAAVAPTLAAPITPGAVSGTYGSSYVDPVTGRVVYASNTTAPNLQTYQDQNTYNQLMGYGGGGHRNAAGFIKPIGWEGDAP